MDYKDQEQIEGQIAKLQNELRILEKEKIEKSKTLEHLENKKNSFLKNALPSKSNETHLNQYSAENEKIRLFMSLFKGRKDVFPLRFQSMKTGKTGYQPACGNEWKKGVCEKPKIKCSDCHNQNFLLVSEDIIRNHLLGCNPNDSRKKEYVIGVYPMLLDETCHFLTVDFDKTTWQEDTKSFLEICVEYGLPAYLERSRSGNGGHIWIFFIEPIKAALARKLGTFLITQTLNTRPDMGLESYDRLFPSQDTLPKGGFGNLIALPLQKGARERNNSVFIDESFQPFDDQWEFLSKIKKVSHQAVHEVLKIEGEKPTSLSLSFTLETEKPWNLPPSRKIIPPKIKSEVPKKIDIVLNDQIYIAKGGLPPELRNHIIHLAAFQNPEFYKAQALRISTFKKPRFISCCENFPEYLAIPRGCLENLLELLQNLGIEPVLEDKRNKGIMTSTKFVGELHSEQVRAVNALKRHNTGVLNASTAFGKTVCAIKLISIRKTNTLILVHRKQIVEQWHEKLKIFLAIESKNIGQIGGGKRNPTGIIDIGLLQSLNKKGVVDDVVGNYGHLIVDECHHITAQSFEIIARHCKAKYVLGLSATVDRKDGHHPIIFMNCGPIRYSFTAKEQALLRPFSHKVVVRRTGFRFDHKEPNEEIKITELYNALMNNNSRNNLIASDILSEIQKGRNPIFLTERVDHLHIIENLLKNKVDHIMIFKGGMGKKRYRELLERLNNLDNNENRLIMATGRYLGEGFDDPKLDTLFLGLPVSWKGVLAQYSGRLNRVHYNKKEVVIYDYVDDNEPMLKKMYGRRLRGYQLIGYDRIVEDELNIL